jgi:single-strand DNA-binding protein
MSRSLNRAYLIGNVGGHPDIRTSASGSRVAIFSLATGRRWTDGAGRARERTEWHRIVAWDELVGVVERQLQKGERVYVQGRVEYRSWEGPSGQRRYATEIFAEEVIPLGGAGERFDQNHPS